MAALVIDNQLGAGNFACREFGCGQRVKQVVARRDDQYWRRNFLQRQFVQFEGAIGVNSGKAQRKWFDAIDNAR